MFAVDQAYGDILGRAPSAGERSRAVAALESNASTPSQLIASLVSGEGARDAQPVVRLYLAGLGRLPDRSGLQYWTRRHAAGISIGELAQHFIGSSEFNRRYGAPGNRSYVEVLYRNGHRNAKVPKLGPLTWFAKYFVKIFTQLIVRDHVQSVVSSITNCAALLGAAPSTGATRSSRASRSARMFDAMPSPPARTIDRTLVGAIWSTIS